MTRRSGRLLRAANEDVLGAIVLALIGAVSVSQMGSDVRNWVFPAAITYSLFAIAVVLAIRGIVRNLRRPAAAADSIGTAARREAIDVGVFAIAVVIYVIAIPYAGFWLTSFVMLTCMAVFLSVRRNLRVAAIAALVAAFLCVATYLLFLRVFFVPLPAGWFAALG